MPSDSPDLRRRRFLQATAAAVALGSTSGAATADDGATATTGYGQGGYGEGGYGGASPFASPVGGADAKPTDPDGDGVYEDVDGDGSLTVADVQRLFAYRSGATVTNNTEQFDFDGDDDVDMMDIRALYEEFLDDVRNR